MVLNMAGFNLAHPVILPAGMEKTPAGIRRALDAGAAAITVGSYTVEARPGNGGDKFVYQDGYSVNALGLPNQGIEWLARELPGMVEQTNDAGVPIICSVAGHSPDEYAQLAAVAAHSGADVIELNLSCPNVWGTFGQEGIPCFDPILTAMILSKVEQVTENRHSISVKVSPYSDPFALRAVDQVIVRFPMVHYLTAINTFANVIATNKAGLPMLQGGLGGPALKAIALGQVAQHRLCLPKQVRIIGVGGITSGADVRDMLIAGADMAAVATSYWVKPDNLRRIAQEYQVRYVPEVSHATNQ